MTMGEEPCIRRGVENYNGSKNEFFQCLYFVKDSKCHPDELFVSVTCGIFHLDCHHVAKLRKLDLTAPVLIKLIDQL